MWDFLNVRRPQGQPEFGAWNSCIVDDQFMNAVSGRTDLRSERLLADSSTSRTSSRTRSSSHRCTLGRAPMMISCCSLSAFSMRCEHGLETLLAPTAELVSPCRADPRRPTLSRRWTMHKPLSASTPTTVPLYLGEVSTFASDSISRSSKFLSRSWATRGMSSWSDTRHFLVLSTTVILGRITVSDCQPAQDPHSHLRRCTAHLGIVPLDESQTPPRIAKGMTLAPSNRYWKEVAEPSSIGGIPTPLIIFDLDGTLYHRPPTVMEHHAGGIPCGRPSVKKRSAGRAAVLTVTSADTSTQS